MIALTTLTYRWRRRSFDSKEHCMLWSFPLIKYILPTGRIGLMFTEFVWWKRRLLYFEHTRTMYQLKNSIHFFDKEINLPTEEKASSDWSSNIKRHVTGKNQDTYINRIKSPKSGMSIDLSTETFSSKSDINLFKSVKNSYEEIGILLVFQPINWWLKRVDWRETAK